MPTPTALVRSEQHARAARARWDRDAARHGRSPGPRILRLDELTPEQAAVVRALLDATSKATPVIETPDVAQTDGNTSDEPSAA